MSDKVAHATTFRGVTEAFVQLESDLALFDVEVAGIRVWEHLRLPSQFDVLKAAGLIGDPHARPPATWTAQAARAARYARNAARAGPLRTGEAELLVVGESRRKRHADGTWWDIFCDPLLPEVARSWRYFEYPFRATHHTPTRTPRVGHLDAIPLLGTLRGQSLPATFDQDGRRALAAANERIHRQFGIDLDLLARARAVSKRVRGEAPLYDRLLAAVSPEVLVLVNSPGKRSLIAAAKRAAIPVVELQHGNFGELDLGYAFPRAADATLPDHFFAFGDAWRALSPLPLPRDMHHSVGYAYLEMHARPRTPQTTSRVLFVSQGTIGAAMSRVAVALASTHEGEVVYKLHPGEAGRWRHEYPWLLGSRVRVIEGEEPGLYDLFASSTALVGVYSTALFEGASVGLPVFLLDLPGIEYMDHALKLGLATKVASVEELAAALVAGRPQTVPASDLFRPGATRHFVDALERVIGG